MIFLLLAVLLFQAAAVFVVSRQVEACWTQYERTRAFGELDACLESKCAEAGYLERVSDPTAPRGTQLLLKKAFVYGDSVQDRVQLRQLPLHKLIMWRAIRHEFLFPSSRAGTDTEEILQVPDPSLFSFEEYLRTRLGTTVLALVEVDIGSWFLALLLILPLTYICSSLPFDQVLSLQCSLAWLLAAAALALTLILEEDTYELTPGVPEDMRQTLRLFSGTSFQMLRRCRLPGYKHRSLAGRRFRPGLADAEEKGQNAKMSLPPRFAAGPLAEATGWPAPETYRRLLRLLAFFQAVCVTSLIVTYLSEPLESWLDIGLYCLAWAEWPLMLFQLVPVLLRRLTLRTSIEDQKDASVIRKISLKSKQSLIRDLRRLVQLTSFQRHARLNCKVWASYACLRPGSWSENQAEAARNLGLQRFNSLPEAEQLEIWALFAGWDADNDGVAHTQEIVEMFAMMGYPEGKEEAAESLIRLVDDVGDEALTWTKFKSLFGLALSEQSCSDEVKEGLGCIFAKCAQDGASRVSVFELSEGLLKVPIFLSPDDVANLLHSYFGQAMPSITKAQFVEWVIAGGSFEAKGAEHE
ncbi:unnamed protein product [Polarella glacialis]|uniref:EF-hand domain-containing protein n=1 Tax=Polarella glacialis TaxID=89957 RepID=A0A813EDD6_POLGL|nr:unnamed protein product [Polarella glacialis]